jgi:hypothetical protein
MVIARFRSTTRKVIQSRLVAPVVTALAGGRVVRLRNCGMFANVNEVMERLRLVEAGAEIFFIDWQDSPYASVEHGNNVWEYYFEQPLLDQRPACFAPYAVGVEQIARDSQNIFSRHQGHLLLPPTFEDRIQAGKIIASHLKLRQPIVSKIAEVAAQHDLSSTIAAHIRGQAFTQRHGGREAARLMQTDFWEPYFECIEIAAEKHGLSSVLICSDSSAVIDEAYKRFGQSLITYEAQRSPFGELHHQRDENKGYSSDPYLLGVDIIVEAHLMAECPVFVHGRSSVANFVLCKAPSAAAISVLDHIQAAEAVT